MIALQNVVLLLGHNKLKHAPLWAACNPPLSSILLSVSSAKWLLLAEHIIAAQTQNMCLVVPKSKFACRLPLAHNSKMWSLIAESAAQQTSSGPHRLSLSLSPLTLHSKKHGPHLEYRPWHQVIALAEVFRQSAGFFMQPHRLQLPRPAWVLMSPLEWDQCHTLRFCSTQACILPVLWQYSHIS